MISIEVKNRLLQSLSDLIARVQANSGMQESEVVTLLGTYFATDAQAIDNTNVSKLVSPRAAYLAAKAAIDEWVGAAPDVLDTIQEIAAALNDDPNAFNTLMSAITTIQQTLGNAGIGTLIDFGTKIDYISQDLLAKESLTNGIYFGFCQSDHANVSVTIIYPPQPGFMIVKIHDYYAEGDTPPEGEENRKRLVWEFRSGQYNLVRVSDSRDPAGINFTKAWKSVSELAERVAELSDNDFAVFTGGPSAIVDIANGTYFKRLSDSWLGWAKAIAGLGADNTSAQAFIIVSDGPVQDSKIATLTIIGNVSIAVLVLDSDADTSVATQIGGTAGSVQVLTAAQLNDLLTTPGLTASKNGFYIAEIVKTSAVWTKFPALPDGIVAGDHKYSVYVTVSDDSGDKRAVMNIIGEGDHYAITYSANDGFSQIYAYATSTFVEGEVLDVYTELESGFTRMGYTAGQAVDDLTDSNFSYTAPAGNTKSAVELVISGNGTYFARGIATDADSNEVPTSLDSSWWLPYGAVSTDYQIKASYTTGSPSAATTIGTSYVTAPSGTNNVKVVIEDTVAGTPVSLSGNIHLKHIASGIETVLPFTMYTLLSA